MGDEAVGTLEVSRTELLDEVDARFQKRLTEFFASRRESTDLAPHAQADPPAPEWFATMAQELPEVQPERGQVIPLERTADGTWHILNEDEVRNRVLYAEHRQGAMAFVQQLDNIGGLDVPWGSILVGGVSGAVVGELVDGFLPLRTDDDKLNPLNPLVKIGVAAVGTRVVDGQFGRSAAILFAGALGVQVLATILPLDEAVASVIDWFGGLFGENNGDEAATGSQGQDADHGQLPVTEGPAGGNPVLAVLERAA